MNRRHPEGTVLHLAPVDSSSTRTITRITLAGFFSAEDYPDMLYDDVTGVEEWSKPPEAAP